MGVSFVSPTKITLLFQEKYEIRRERMSNSINPIRFFIRMYRKTFWRELTAGRFQGKISPIANCLQTRADYQKSLLQ